MSTPQTHEGSRPDRVVLADASDGTLGPGFAARFGVTGAKDEDDGAPVVRKEDEVVLDWRQVRVHDLGQDLAKGVRDRRATFQTVNDFDAEYGPSKDGMSPYAQAEWITARNRSTREADGHGRVAVPSSQRRVVDSEDQLYAIATTLNELPLAAPSFRGGSSGDALPELAGVVFKEAGVEAGSGGTVVRGEPSVSVQGLTIEGEAAVQAARDAIERGGTAQDAAAAAVAASKGRAPPPLTPERDAPTTQTRAEPPAVPTFKRPAGYVVNQDRQVGVLGSFFTPRCGHAFASGREGTPIGTLPMRHDAQVALDEETRGRFHIKKDDVASLPEPRDGELVKGWLMPDSSVAGQDTELPGDVMQLRPVVRVTAKLGPSREPPPPEPPPEEEPPPIGVIPGWWSPPPGSRGPGGPAGVAGGGAAPGAAGDGAGQAGPDTGGAPVRRRRVATGEGIGVMPGTPGVTRGAGDLVRDPVDDAQAQGRDFTGEVVPPVPCPLQTAGARVAIAIAGAPVRLPGGLPVVDLGGGLVQFTPGFPSVRRSGDQVLLGGQEPGPGGAPRAVPQRDRVQALSGRDGWGLEFLDRHGRPIPPAELDRINDPRVPLDELEEEIPVAHLPRAVQGQARALRAARREAEARAAAKAKQPTTKKDVLDRQAESLERRAKREDERFEEAQRRVREAREVERRRSGGKPSRETQRLTDELGRLEKARQARKARNDRAKDQNDRARRRRDERKARPDTGEKEAQRRGGWVRRRRQRAEDAARAGRTTPSEPYAVDVTDPAHPVTYGAYPDAVQGDWPGGRTGPATDEEADDVRQREREGEEARAKYGGPTSTPHHPDFGDDFRGAGDRGRYGRFGDHNVLTTPTPLLGQAGGPKDVEGTLAWYGMTLEALRRVVLGAFGGPSTLASNLAVIHRNTPGNPPAGSRVGAAWSVLPGEAELVVCGVPVAEVVSALKAAAGTKAKAACDGAVLRVAKEHAGEGAFEDDRALVLLDDSLARTEGDLVRDVTGRFRVGADRGVTATKVRVEVPCDQRGPALEVVRVCEGQPEASVVAVLQDGTLDASAGASVSERLVLAPGASVELASAGDGPSARVTLTDGALVLQLGEGEARRSVVLSPKGLLVEGDVVVTGKVVQG